MKKFMKYFLLLALVPALLFTSCKDDNDPVEENVAFNTLKTYLVENNMDLNQIINTTEHGKFATKTIEGKFIIDIRSADAFAASHLDGAVNSTLGNVLETAKQAGDKPILVVCYSGQTAARAVCALRLSGYPKAAILKWGMSGQGKSESWNSNVGDIAENHENWSDAAPVANDTYLTPVLYTTATDGATILKERVAAMLANTEWTVKNTDVLANPENYQINNYFPEVDWTGFGHFKGAHRINPLTLSGNQFENLNPGAKIVTYCYTGQTSSLITAYLEVMGYQNAKSLLFGMNGLQHSHSQWTDNAAITGNQWTAH